MNDCVNCREARIKIKNLGISLDVARSDLNSAMKYLQKVLKLPESGTPEARLIIKLLEEG